MIYKHQLSHTKWVLIDSLYSHNNRDVIINKNENSFYYINTTSIPILSYTTILVYVIYYHCSYNQMWLLPHPINQEMKSRYNPLGFMLKILYIDLGTGLSLILILHRRSTESNGN